MRKYFSCFVVIVFVVLLVIGGRADYNYVTENHKAVIM